MSAQSDVRDWVLAQEPGTYFVSSDVPAPSATAAVALSRMATQEGPVVRLRQGIYLRKGDATRFGPERADPMAVALIAGGAGAGAAGSSAANLLGLSTQVPRRPHVAVVGRAPKGLDGVRVTTRSNAHRILLSPTEVAVLECLRDYDRSSELPWRVGRGRLRDLEAEGRIDLASIARVATHERCAGLRDRISELISA
jgi:hypothetical protein